MTRKKWWEVGLALSEMEDSLSEGSAAQMGYPRTSKMN